MKSDLITLDTLPSITSIQLNTLHRLGVLTLADLLRFAPVRQARAVQAWRDGLLRDNEVSVYLHDGAQGKSAETLLKGAPKSLAAVTNEVAAELNHLGLKTVLDLANFAVFSEAERVVSSTGDDAQTDPSGPQCVVPTCRQFTRNTKRYVSFFRQVELRNLSISLSTNVNVKGIPLLPLAHLFDYRANEPRTIHLGYSMVYQQDWIYTGIHLGEPRGGVSMFMGEDTQVSVLDFQRITRASQQERNSSTERLTNVLIHQRAVDEVARATAEEHQQGATSGFGANAATAGSFTAAGAVIGGVGGGISGAIAGLVIGNVANAAGGLPTIGGAIAGAALGSAAGAAAGSLIASGAATLGIVETDAEGDREIFARSAQNIQQRTVQNASSIRSFWSSIVSQSLQSEEQTVRTNRVTNHNRIHALNALYFEVLANYRVNVAPIDFDALLFLPFKPIRFNAANLGQFWWIIRNSLGDKALIASLDQHFLTLNTDLSVDAQADDILTLSDVKSTKITVKVNLDGTAIEAAIRAAIIAAAVVPVTGLIGLLATIVGNFIDGIKRDKVRVSLITTLSGTDREINLTRATSPNDDKDFIGTFTTSRSVPLASITKVRIRNDNPNQKINFGVGEIDFAEVHFEDITARVTIANKAALRRQVSGIDALEASTIIADKLSVNSNSSRRVSWAIADQLADAFQGVDDATDALDDAQDLVAAQIENLLSFLNANCFTFTRLIMQTVEREQIAAILELLEINGEPLSRIAGTTPIGFTGNQVILPLKKRGGFATKYESANWDTTKLRSQLEALNERDLMSPKTIIAQLGKLLEASTTFLDETKGNNASHTPFEKTLLAQVAQLHQLAQRLQSSQGQIGGVNLLSARQLIELRELIASINHRLSRPAHGTSEKMATLIGFSEDLRNDLAPRMGKIISSDEVALPTPALFMEPVLSHSKGAELLDIRRNSHYDLFEAPGIAASDPNTLRGQYITLSPTVPATVLQQQEGPQLPLPSNLTAALGEAGRLNLGTLISTNAASFQNLVSTLATLSAELAKASATLTGDAQRQVLQAATDVSKQIGGLVESGLSQASQLAQSSPSIQPTLSVPQQTPPSAAPPPPVTQQDKGAMLNALERIDKSQATPSQKAERKAAIGAPTRKPTSLDYRFKLSFFDQLGSLLPEGSFTAQLAFASPNSPSATDIVDLNGGQPIPLNLPGGFITSEPITLETGRLFTFAFNTDVNGINLPGSADLRLPTNPDVLLHVRLGFTTEKVTTTNVISKLKERSLTTTFGVAGQLLLEQLLNGTAKFPLFKVFEIEAGGSSKRAIDLKAEFDRVTAETDTETDTNTVTREFEMQLPTGWVVTVNPL